MSEVRSVEEVKCLHCGARIEPDIDSGLYECGCVAMDALAQVGPLNLWDCSQCGFELEALECPDDCPHCGDPMVKS